MSRFERFDAASAAKDLERLNKDCFCPSVDAGTLRLAFEEAPGNEDLFKLVQERCPHVFSPGPVFMSAGHLLRMQSIIGAVESVIALPAWQARVLAAAPATARLAPPGPKGVFMGYDFHVNAGSPGLIEINTNAGGAMLNAVLAKAQRACCPEIAQMVPTASSLARLEQEIIAMFINEWRVSGREGPLRSIAIIDERPQQQYLYPEFLLFRRLFERNGLTALVIGPDEVQLRNGALWHGDIRIDLVYNRLTDFALETANSAVLREAYLENSVVLTPNPRMHALYADKRNLALLTDASELTALGVSPAVQEILLAGIPHTEIVSALHDERLWAARRHLFFKPASGFGSRATYRGDKITRRVWQDILRGDYVAQSIVQPGERTIAEGDEPRTLKFDVRNYAYDGAVQWVAARLYQGQTTNFRTPGGGFAPIYTYPLAEVAPKIS